MARATARRIGDRGCAPDDVGRRAARVDRSLHIVELNPPARSGAGDRAKIDAAFGSELAGDGRTADAFAVARRRRGCRGVAGVAAQLQSAARGAAAASAPAPRRTRSRRPDRRPSLGCRLAPGSASAARSQPPRFQRPIFRFRLRAAAHPQSRASPTFFSQRTTLTSSITRPTFGISCATSVTDAHLHRSSRTARTISALPGSNARSSSGAKGIGAKRAAHAQHRRVEFVEELRADARCDLGAHAAVAAPPHAQSARDESSTPDAAMRRHIERQQRPQVDDFSRDAVLRQFLRRFQRGLHHRRIGDQR